MADVELLPLPEWMDGYTIPADDFEHDGDDRLSERMRDYARANVEHAAAAQAAEIEALRTEVERSERYAEQSERERLWAEERAERLAEALREAYGQVRELCDCYGHVYPEASFVRYEYLLREQEDA